MPQISVILPVYNAELYIKDAIDSILNQTFTDFELLIFDDGSTDNTQSIISSFIDTRIVYSRIEKNAGYLNLLNKGLEVAKGKYIARMDADDIALPNRFKKQVDHLEKNTEVGICGCWTEFIGDKEGIAKLPVSSDQVMHAIFFGSPTAHPTIMMRNDLLKKFNLRYDNNYYYTEDYNLLADACVHFKIENLPNVLLKYRIHNTQVSNQKWRQQFGHKCNIQTKLFLRTFDSPTKNDSQWLYTFFSEKGIPNADWLKEVNEYKIKIIEGNKKKVVYPHHILTRATNELFELKVKNNFYKYFFQKYYNQKKYNLTLLNSFLHEKYRPYKYLGKKLTFFFVIKCLAGYKKTVILSE
ncbi:MAG: glycosyltransferase family 2 protein [Bacteroidota bacterium]|nr:glycosyltransferase family 2 protein [Bacteroidota bacterium]